MMEVQALGSVWGMGDGDEGVDVVVEKKEVPRLRRIVELRDWGVIFWHRGV